MALSACYGAIWLMRGSIQATRGDGMICNWLVLFLLHLLSDIVLTGGIDSYEHRSCIAHCKALLFPERNVFTSYLSTPPLGSAIGGRVNRGVNEDLV